MAISPTNRVRETVLMCVGEVHAGMSGNERLRARSAAPDGRCRIVRMSGAPVRLAYAFAARRRGRQLKAAFPESKECRADIMGIDLPAYRPATGRRSPNDRFASVLAHR